MLLILCDDCCYLPFFCNESMLSLNDGRVVVMLTFAIRIAVFLKLFIHIPTTIVTIGITNCLISIVIFS